MKKVLLFGYFEKNLGDDLMLKIFVDEAKKRYEKIYLLSSKKYKKFYENFGCKVICYDSLLYRIINRIFCRKKNDELYYCFLKKKSYDFVMLGGSLFAESDFLHRETQLHNLNCGIDRAVSSFVIGSNFGPFYSNDYVERYKALFEKCEDVCFRDWYSYKLFNGCNNVRYAPDIVLSGKWSNNLEVTSEYNIISVIDISKRKALEKYAEKYMKLIVDLCSKLARNGEKVVLVSMCQKEGDFEYCNKIRDKIDSECRAKINVLQYENIKNVLEIFARSKKVYATRFHAMILGIFFDKPVVSIVYNEKVGNALRSYRAECKVVTMEDIDNSISVDSLINYKHCFISVDLKNEARYQMAGFSDCGKMRYEK